ncbi:MAG: hypothetical protein V3T22_05635 [Planctomycetota bacterium]
MEPMRLPPVPLLPVACLVLLLGSACQDLPTIPGENVQVLQVGALESLNPSDVVVAPVQFAIDGLDVPELQLRKAISEALASRRYTPLDLAFVDSRLLEASHTFGSLGEEVVCQLVVHAWSERLWTTGRALEIELELRMIDPSNPDGPVLWAGRLDTRIDVTSEAGHMSPPALYRLAIARMADELVAPMPRRNTRPGREN